MASPVKPADIAAVVPLPSDTICEQMRKQIILRVLVYRLVKYMYTNNRTVTTQFATDMCAALRRINC